LSVDAELEHVTSVGIATEDTGGDTSRSHEGEGGAVDGAYVGGGITNAHNSFNRFTALIVSAIQIVFTSRAFFTVRLCKAKVNSSKRVTDTTNPISGRKRK
jgi:hypothetical protein